MNYDISKIKEIITSIFSPSGYQMNGLSVQCPSPIDVSIVNNGSNVDIIFNKHLPKATIEKFIKFNLNILGITLGKDGGVLRIKYFPDIKFDYSGSMKFGFNNDLDLDFIVNDIDMEYNDAERKKIANRCLQYGKEWATIVSSDTNIKEISNIRERKKLRKQCYNFIFENAKHDKEIVCGSVVLTILIINFLLPIIINWVVTKILNHWWNS